MSTRVYIQSVKDHKSAQLTAPRWRTSPSVETASRTADNGTGSPLVPNERIRRVAESPASAGDSPCCDLLPM